MDESATKADIDAKLAAARAARTQQRTTAHGFKVLTEEERRKANPDPNAKFKVTKKIQREKLKSRSGKSNLTTSVIDWSPPPDATVKEVYLDLKNRFLRSELIDSENAPAEMGRLFYTLGHDQPVVDFRNRLLELMPRAFKWLEENQTPVAPEVDSWLTMMNENIKFDERTPQKKIEILTKMKAWVVSFSKSLDLDKHYNKDRGAWLIEGETISELRVDQHLVETYMEMMREMIESGGGQSIGNAKAHVQLRNAIVELKTAIKAKAAFDFTRETGKQANPGQPRTLLTDLATSLAVCRTKGLPEADEFLGLLAVYTIMWPDEADTVKKMSDAACEKLKSWQDSGVALSCQMANLPRLFTLYAVLFRAGITTEYDVSKFLGEFFKARGRVELHRMLKEKYRSVYDVIYKKEIPLNTNPLIVTANRLQDAVASVYYTQNPINLMLMKDPKAKLAALALYYDFESQYNPEVSQTVVSDEGITLKDGQIKSSIHLLHRLLTKCSHMLESTGEVVGDARNCSIEPDPDTSFGDRKFKDAKKDYREHDDGDQGQSPHGSSEEPGDTASDTVESDSEPQQDPEDDDLDNLIRTHKTELDKYVSGFFSANIELPLIVPEPESTAETAELQARQSRQKEKQSVRGKEFWQVPITTEKIRSRSRSKSTEQRRNLKSSTPKSARSRAATPRDIVKILGPWLQTAHPDILTLNDHDKTLNLTEFEIIHGKILRDNYILSELKASTGIDLNSPVIVVDGKLRMLNQVDLTKETTTDQTTTHGILGVSPLVNTGTTGTTTARALFQQTEGSHEAGTAGSDNLTSESIFGVEIVNGELVSTADRRESRKRAAVTSPSNWTCGVMKALCQQFPELSLNSNGTQFDPGYTNTHLEVTDPTSTVSRNSHFSIKNYGVSAWLCDSELIFSYHLAINCALITDNVLDSGVSIDFPGGLSKIYIGFAEGSITVVGKYRIKMASVEIEKIPASFIDRTASSTSGVLDDITKVVTVSVLCCTSDWKSCFYILPGYFEEGVCFEYTDSESARGKLLLLVQRVHNVYRSGAYASPRKQQHVSQTSHTSAHVSTSTGASTTVHKGKLTTDEYPHEALLSTEFTASHENVSKYRPVAQSALGSVFSDLSKVPPEQIDLLNSVFKSGVNIASDESVVSTPYGCKDTTFKLKAGVNETVYTKHNTFEKTDIAVYSYDLNAFTGTREVLIFCDLHIVPSHLSRNGNPVVIAATHTDLGSSGDEWDIMPKTSLKVIGKSPEESIEIIDKVAKEYRDDTKKLMQRFYGEEGRFYLAWKRIIVMKCLWLKLDNALANGVPILNSSDTNALADSVLRTVLTKLEVHMFRDGKDLGQIKSVADLQGSFSRYTQPVAYNSLLFGVLQRSTRLCVAPSDCFSRRATLAAWSAECLSKKVRSLMKKKRPLEFDNNTRSYKDNKETFVFFCGDRDQPNPVFVGFLKPAADADDSVLSEERSDAAIRAGESAVE